MSELTVDVTAQAVRIFGADLVARATQVRPNSLHPVRADDGRNRIDLKHGDVVIEFTNGRRVVFCTSEWGDIASPGESATSDL